MEQADQSHRDLRAEVERLRTQAEGWKSELDRESELLRLRRERDQARAEVERLSADDARQRGRMAVQAFTAPDADWDTMWMSLTSRLADLHANNERLREENGALKDHAKTLGTENERLNAAVQAVRHLRDETELRNHNSALWQRLDAALGGERDE